MTRKIKSIKNYSTFLHTAEKNWLSKFKNNENFNSHYGHGFCECFYYDEWILVDPTCKKYQINYDLNPIQLDYNVGDNNEFVPYLRALDLNVKQSIKDYHKTMDKLCLKL